MADRYENVRTFVTVVDCGGISSAAARLGIAKSAVSRRLSDLEAQLNTVLIERSTRSFHVTDVGRIYHERATRLRADWKDLDRSASFDKTRDTLAIAAPETVLTHLVAPAVAALRRRQDIADVRLTLVHEGSAADLTIALGSDVANDRTLHRIGDVGRVVCAARGYLEAAGTPTTLDELESHSGVAVESAGTLDWTLIEA